jgi:hypothetical protein
MKSEDASALEAFDPVEEFARLDRECEPGERRELDAWRDGDPCGRDAFTALARRFGWKREEGEEGTWLFERRPRWTPGWIGPEHKDAWFALFEAAFGYRMDEALFRWKYRHEARPGMGAWRDGELVAFYGGMTREVLHAGRAARTVQIGDVMTRPDERGVMTRSGPFQIAAATFIERSVGYGRHFLFGYGFPTEKALQVAQKLGLYEQVDQIVQAVWESSRERAGLFEAVEPVQPRHRDAVQRLWHDMARQFGASVIGERDWDYLQDRFARHPVNPYRLLAVRRRFSGKLQGVLVVRDREDAGLEILDLVGPPDNFPALLRAARREAASLNRERAFMWLTESHGSLLAATQAEIAPLGLVVPANVWTRGPGVDELRGRWWLTGSDMDFR